MTNPKRGIYPGSFDPITLGHLDIIRRATRAVDHLIIGVAANDGKNPVFSVEERVALVEADIATLDTTATIEVIAFDGLLEPFQISNTNSRWLV